MKIKKMVVGMIMILFSLALTSSVLVPTTAAIYGDSFNIDVNLLKEKESFSGYYKSPDNYQLDLSNSSIVCPSNNCKAQLKNFILDIDEESNTTNTMVVIADFKIVDDGSNADLTPKKRNLIEQSSFDFGCSFTDIQEDILKKTTKYICSEPKNEDIVRNFNSTHYPYTVTATFELPSKHLVLNATEEHDLTYSAFPGHVIFRNETGSIVIK